MIDKIRNKLESRYGFKNISLVKLRGGDEKKLLFFVFEGANSIPVLCLKTGSSLNDNDLIKKEFDNLKSARGLLDEKMKETLPEPKELLEIDSRIFAVEEVFVGDQFSKDIKKGKLEDIFEWLCKFHKSNIVGSENISKSFWVDFLTGYKDKIKCLNNEDKFLLAIKNFVDKNWTHKDIKLDFIKQHGDFHFANIFYKKGQLKVIDWGNYGRVFLPAYDLMFFLNRQKNGLSEKDSFLLRYFELFSMPISLILVWIKFITLVEGFEKWSNFDEFVPYGVLDEYLDEEFLCLIQK